MQKMALTDGKGVLRMGKESYQQVRNTHVSVQSLSL